MEGDGTYLCPMQVQVSRAAMLEGHANAVYMVGATADATHIYSGGGDNVLVEWDLGSFEALRVVARTPGVIYSTCIIPEYGLLLVGNNHGGIHVIDLREQTEIRYLLAHSNGVFDLLWHKEQERVYATGADGRLSVWDIRTFHCLETLGLCDAKLRHIRVSPDGNLLAVACGDNRVRVISVGTLQTVHAWEAHTMAVNALAFHPSGDYLLSGGKDAHLNVWAVRRDFEPVMSIPAHNYAIYSIVFHPGGHLFATGSRDKTIKLWDARSFGFLLRIDNEQHSGHTRSVNTLHWSACNNYLISGSDDRSVMVWSISTSG